MIPMTRVAAAIGVLVVAAAPAGAQRCPHDRPVAFVGADVLTMSDSVLLRGQTVVVESGRITAMGSSGVPRDACRIDATGKVLLPGLADMHAHITERDLPLFLANGVTLVREMNGSPGHLALRDRLARGEVLGPRLVVTSPLLTGKKLRYRHRLITSREDAYAAAHEAKSAGYDFLKIYDDLTLDQYEALVEAGRTLGIRLDGHVPREVGLDHVLAAGQAIQHMDKIVLALAGHQADTARLLPEARRLFTGRLAWVTPTLASLRVLDRAGTAGYASRFLRPEMIYVDSASLGWWRSFSRAGNRPEKASAFYEAQVALLRALAASGTRLLLGTDAANPMMIAGFSVHEELETLVRDAGLAPYEALRLATRNPAEFLADADGGQVRVGARADLLLVDANPLADLATLRRPRGVMMGGRWLDRPELDQALRSAVRSTLPPR